MLRRSLGFAIIIVIVSVVVFRMGIGTQVSVEEDSVESTSLNQPVLVEPANVDRDLKNANVAGPNPKSIGTDDVTQELEQSDWFGQVQEGIRKAEYNVTWQDESVVKGAPGGLHIANRANNIRAYFREDGVQIVERETANPEWDIQWQFKSWGRDGSMTDVSPVTPSHEENTNRVTYNYPNIEEWFINDERGLEHGFTIATKPTGEGPLILTGAFGGSTEAKNAARPDTIEFQDDSGYTRLQYAKLEVVDANNKPLQATLRRWQGETRFVVHDTDAAYPVTVDPIYVPPLTGDWQVDLQQAIALSGAGDVNGDGYADVIVGAPDYDNGEPTEGAAFVFLGSSSGLVGTSPATASAVLESNQDGTYYTLNGTAFGFSVSGAGDVNGDGYADVIVGAPGYDNGESEEGAAFVFLGQDNSGGGSPLVGAGTLAVGPGNPATASAVLESNQDNAEMGLSVSGAGDVNGDGYADVIVGAPSYDNGELFEGAAFVFLGSSSGLVGAGGLATPGSPATAAAMLESNQYWAEMGLSVSGAGDVNGDGYTDVIVGAPFYDNGNSADAAFVYLGRDNSGGGSPLVGAGTLAVGPGNPATASAVLESMGLSVSGAGDVNGDGYADVIGGAPGYTNGEYREGAAFIFLGSSSGLVGTSPATASGVLESNQDNAEVGRSVSGVGDVNGDGYADVIVGAASGPAIVFHGFPTGLLGTDPASASAVLESNQDNAEMGRSVSGAGDVNGDGYADLIVGVPDYDNGEHDEGAAFVFLGSSSGLVGAGGLATPGSPAMAAAVLESNQAHVDSDSYRPQFGFSVSGAGDVNGDGYADVIVGAPGYANGESEEGAAFVFLGRDNSGGGSPLVGADTLAVGPGNPATASAVLESNQDGSSFNGPQFGRSVSGAGDVNGDGYADVIVGAPDYDNGVFNEGAAFVFLGSSSGLVGTSPATASAVLESDQGGGPGPQFGESVSGAGDVNGDGYADVIVGAPDYYNGESEEGAAFVFLGSSSGLVGTSPATASAVLESNQSGLTDSYGGPDFGRSVSGAGDVNGDGCADVIVGAPGYANGEYREGAAFVFLGSSSGLVGTSPATASAVLESNQADFSGPGPYFGFSVSGAGDVNGDGYADVIVGAPDYNNEENAEGAAFVFLGSSSGLVGTSPATASAVLESNQGGSFGAEMGRSVSGAGDVNGDGYADVIVGAPSYNNGESDEGASFVFLGTSEGKLVDAHISKSGYSRVATPGIGQGTTDFDVTLIAHSMPEMPSAVGIEWEVTSYGTPFDGVGTSTTSTWQDSGPTGHTFTETFSVPGDANGWKWRARVLYAPLNKFDDNVGTLTLKPGVSLPPNTPHSRWYYPHWATVGPSDFRTNGYLPPTDPAGVTVTQTDLYTTSDIVATVGTPSTSPATPTESIQYEYVWTTGDGQKEVTHLTSSTTDTLDSSETAKGEIWMCTVRAYDGVSYSHLSDADTAPAILNTAPEAPTVSVPSLESTSQNLMASVTEASIDPDIDPIQYDFDWYRKPSGGSFSLYRNGSLSPSLNSQINDTETAVDDEWYVVVTPHDGEEFGTPFTSIASPTTIVQGGVTPSFISLGASPTSIALGDSVTLSGQIFPTPLGTEIVSFESTDPDGGTVSNYPDGTSTPDGIYSTDYFPNAATAGRAPWEVVASWDGDNTYTAASSSSVNITVSKGNLDLSVELDTSTAPLPYSDLGATVSVNSSLPTELLPLLSGLSVNLRLREPDGTPRGPVVGTTDANGVLTFDPSDFAGAGITFDEAGKWEFLAEFIGDDNFNASTSTPFGDPETPFLTIKDKNGYAIIVVGKLDSAEEGLPEHSKTADRVYQQMIDQGLAPDDILYLRDTTTGSYTGNVAAVDIPDGATLPWTPDKDDFINAISATTLGAGGFLVPKLNDAAAPVWIVMLDHGREDEFYMFSGDLNNRSVTPSELDTAIDSIDPLMSGEDLVVVYGACYSGSFMSSLSKPGRTIVTSSSSFEVSHRGPAESDGVRDGEFFVSELFRGLGLGLGLRDAFQDAAERTSEFTFDSTTNGAGGTSPQTPLIDANGDQAPSNSDQLNDVAGGDGANAFDITLGVSTNSPDDAVGWITASETVQAGVTLSFLSATATVDGYDADKNEAWIEVKQPTYSGGSIPSGGESDLQQEVGLVRIEPDTQSAQDKIDRLYKWSNLSGVINESNPGTYKVFYYIKDDATDPDSPVSEYLLTTVYRAAAGNTPPGEVPALIAPNDLSTMARTVFFAWSPATDAQGDGVTYTVQLATDSGFTTGLISVAGIPDPYITLGAADGIDDLKTYYWRVIPVDEYGAAASGPHLTRSFDVDTNNPPDPVVLWGEATNTNNGAPVVTGTVTVTHVEGMSTINDFSATITDGTYASSPFTDADANTDYTITISASGYNTRVLTNQEIVPGGPGGYGAQQMNVELTPVTVADSGAPAKQARHHFGQYDTNNDGKLSLSEWLNAGLSAADFINLDTNANGYLSLTELFSETGLILGSRSTVYVDFGEFNISETPDGTSGNPLRTLTEALALVTHDGSGVITMKGGGTSSETFTGGAVIHPANTITLTQHNSGSVQIGVPEVAPDAAPSRYTNRANEDGEQSSTDGADSVAYTLSDAARAAELRAFNTAVFEAVIPTATDSDGNRIVAADGTIAIRLRDYTGLDLQTLWAELYPEQGPEEVAFQWISATDDEKARDIWVLFDPAEVWRIHEFLTAIAGGATNDGIQLQGEPVSATIDDTLDAKIVTVTPVTITNADGTQTAAWQIAPDQVFTEPVEVTLPIPAGIDPSTLQVLYYKSADPNQGWHNATDVVGLLAEPTTVESGQAHITLNHGGVLRLR